MSRDRVAGAPGVPGTTHETGRPAAVTTEAALRAGEPGRLGWCEVVVGPGEPHVGAPPHGGAHVLGALVHLTDLHLCDAESPARLEHLDHHGDPGEPYAQALGLVGTYRPQEVLTVQVAAAALDAVHRLGRAPVTGAGLDAVLVTGDVLDNAQRNELRWYVELMQGRTVVPASGDPRLSSWVGARGAGRRLPRFWHPDGPARGDDADVLTARHGFPQVPGLVPAARRPVGSPGAGLPWLTVHGNHDALLQGTVPVAPELADLATGSRRVVGLGGRRTPLAALESIPGVGPARYLLDRDAPDVRVRADPERQVVGPREVAAAVAAAGGAPFDRDRNHWAVDVGELRVVALDTVNPHGGWQGSVDAEQLVWLERELRRSHDRYVVLTSHHPSWTLVNGWAPPGHPPRHLADAVLSLALAHPCVIAWVAGHVHAHGQVWHQAPDRAGGLWEITTASLVDWPQQLRVLEVLREPDGTLALASTVVDHAGAVGALGPWLDLADPRALAGASRSLALNDARRRGAVVPRREGRWEDRNAIRRLPDPFA